MEIPVDLSFYTHEFCSDRHQVVVISGQMGSEVTSLESLEQIRPFLVGTGQTQSAPDSEFLGMDVVESLLKVSSELDIDDEHEVYVGKLLGEYHRSQYSTKKEL